MDHSTNKKKEQLRKKLNKQRKEKGQEEVQYANEDSILNMINQVNKTLKENPEMIKKISKCINNVFENKDLMSSLISEVESNVVNNEHSESESDDDEKILNEHSELLSNLKVTVNTIQDEILEIKEVSDSVDALENESTQ
jgi:hypothetical protein